MKTSTSIRCAVIASGLLAAMPARAETDGEAAPKKKDEASLNQLRIDVSGSYFRGTKMLGHGTRAPYQGGAGEGRFDARWFPWRHGGFEATGYYGFGHASADSRGGLMLGIDVAPARWSGAWGGGVILAGGGGFEAGGGSWMRESVRGFPWLGARLVLWPRPKVSARLAWEIVPITTNALRVMENHLELALGCRWAQVGARGGFSQATGGDPSRTYGEVRGSLFFGAAFY